MFSPATRLQVASSLSSAVSATSSDFVSLLPPGVADNARSVSSPWSSTELTQRRAAAPIRLAVQVTGIATAAGPAPCVNSHSTNVTLQIVRASAHRVREPSRCRRLLRASWLSLHQGGPHHVNRGPTTPRDQSGRASCCSSFPAYLRDLGAAGVSPSSVWP